MVEGQQSSIIEGITSTATQEQKKKLLVTQTKEDGRQTSTSNVRRVALLLVVIVVLVTAIVKPLVLMKKRQSSASNNNNNNAAIVATTPSSEFLYLDGVGFLYLHGSTTSTKTVMVFQTLCPDGEADDSWVGCSGCGLSTCPDTAVCVCGTSWDFIPASSQGSSSSSFTTEEEGLDTFQIMDECNRFREFFDDDSRYGVFYCGTQYGAVTAQPINTTISLDWENDGSDSDYNSHMQEVVEFLRDSEEFQTLRNNQ
jgi:hypothetical protein